MFLSFFSELYGIINLKAATPTKDFFKWFYMQLWQRDELRSWISLYIEQDWFRQLLFINDPFCFALTLQNLHGGVFFENRHQSTIIELKQKTSTHLSHPLQLRIAEASLVHFPSYWQNYLAIKLTNKLCHTCQRG